MLEDFKQKLEKRTLMDQIFLKSLNQSLDKILENKKTFLIGEDLNDPYGGAFKVTKNLSIKYPDQVFQHQLVKLQ